MLASSSGARTAPETAIQRGSTPPLVVFLTVLAILVVHDIYAWARGYTSAGDTAPAWIFLAVAFAAGLVVRRR